MMMPRKKRRAILISVILVVIIIILTILIVLYNTTDMFKSNDVLFSKYASQIFNNIDEILRDYVKRVETVEAKNEEIISFCKGLDDNIKICSQKMGLVRYNAFKDTGSDLSFALAILDEYNNGIVLNGIYARDSSNIYAKPVENGQSKYILSEEEKEAINRAINNIKQ